jgi:hypothetical protein
MDTIHLSMDLYNNPKSFERPSVIIEALFCRDSGMAPGPNCDLDPRGRRQEMGYFEKGLEPVEQCDGHVRVNWCTITGAVAGPGCAPESTKDIALVRNDGREWSQNAYVADAQYTYRDVGANYVYPSSASRPFYQNLLEEGYFAGTSGAGRPINSFCIEHNPTLTWAVEVRPRATEPATPEPATPEPTIPEPATPAPTEPDTEPPAPDPDAPPVPEPTIGSGSGDGGDNNQDNNIDPGNNDTNDIPGE